MNIKAISFAGTYNTREVANIVGGKENANVKFISSLTGIPKDTLLTTYSADIFSAGSSYCASKISEINPALKGLRQLSLDIKSLLKSQNFQDVDFAKVDKLVAKRDKAIDSFCQKQGETIEIPDFQIPFFHK